MENPYIHLPLPLSKYFHHLTRDYIGVISSKLSHLDIDRYYYPLDVIYKHNGEITQQQLSKEIQADKVSTNRITHYLLSKGYITKNRHEEDKRAFLVSLTQKGKEAAIEIGRAFNEVNALCFHGMDKESQQHFIDQVKHIKSNLENHPKHNVSFKYRKISNKK